MEASRKMALEVREQAGLQVLKLPKKVGPLSETGVQPWVK